MKIGNRNVKVLKKAANREIGVKVELTSKMTVAGKIIKAVVVTNAFGDHIILKTYNNLKDAFETYKKACFFYIFKAGLYKAMI